MHRMDWIFARFPIRCTGPSRKPGTWADDSCWYSSNGGTSAIRHPYCPLNLASGYRCALGEAIGKPTCQAPTGRRFGTGLMIKGRQSPPLPGTLPVRNGSPERFEVVADCAGYGSATRGWVRSARYLEAPNGHIGLSIPGTTHYFPDSCKVLRRMPSTARSFSRPASSLVRIRAERPSTGTVADPTLTMTASWSKSS